jgi:predicted Ser/Thr protein kinase
METERICPSCHKPLPPDVPLGLCPECLMKSGLNTGTEPGGEGPKRSGFVPPPVADIARLFPQLEVLEFVGKGGMGAVYKARQPALDRLVALKILPPATAGDPGFAERFNREARALARLNHPNIVAVHDFGQAGTLHYLVMEFVDGGNLRQIERAGRLAPEQALAIVPQICEALQFAHNEGIVHRDIKPENILLDKKGRVKITDFGIAKMLGLTAEQAPLTGARDVVGTPHYMAPEQIEKPRTVDHRADIYSLGVVFYEMLTGELPLGKFAPPSRKVQVDVRLDEVVLHALEKEPERRYQQASQVKTAVETITGTPPQFAPAPVAASVGNPPSGTGKITAPAVALMVAAVWKLLSAFSALFFLAGGSGWLSKFLGFGNLLGGWGSVAIFSIVLFKVIPGLLILFGGFQMLQRRSYAWAMAAGIISIVSCSLIGFPIGIWALIVLARDDVKSAFGSHVPAAPLTPQPDRFWRRFVVVTACIILIPIAIAVVALLAAMFVPALSRAWSRANDVTAQNLEQAGIHQEAGEFRKDSSQSFPLNADGRFSIDNVKGRIEIHGWSSNAVVVNTTIHGKISESVQAVAFDIDSKPDAASVHTKQPSSVTGFPWSWLWFKNDKRNDASVDYTIQVPQRARLADISSVNGRILIDGVSGDIAASTVNGKMQIKNAASDLKLSTVNGQITADMSLLGKGQSVSLDAVNGQVELALPEDADANFSVSTVNGSITTEFPSLKAKKEFPVGNSLKGSLGNGSATVKATAVNGRFKILKRQTAEQTLTNTPAATPN